MGIQGIADMQTRLPVQRNHVSGENKAEQADQEERKSVDKRPAKPSYDKYEPSGAPKQEPSDTPKSEDVPKSEDKEVKCTVNTDKVDAEIKKLREKKQELQQKVNRTQDPEERARLEKELAASEMELQQKDNDSYRKQHAQVHNG